MDTKKRNPESGLKAPPGSESWGDLERRFGVRILPIKRIGPRWSCVDAGGGIPVGPSLRIELPGSWGAVVYGSRETLAGEAGAIESALRNPGI